MSNRMHAGDGYKRHEVGSSFAAGGRGFWERKMVEKRKGQRIQVHWPIQMITDNGTLEAEARNITVAGMFINCQHQLEEDRLYQMIIKLPRHKSIVVKGRLAWSSFDEFDPKNPFSQMGISFLKISDEDRQILRKVIAVYDQID